MTAVAWVAHDRPLIDVLLPALTAHDPAASGEGSRDPLGLEAAAERLASLYLPAVTSRMTRIRALTVLALSAHVCHPMLDDYTADDRAVVARVRMDVG